MLKIRSGWLGTVLAVSLSLSGTGCYVTAQPAYVVDSEPPAPQYEQVTVQPGRVWVKGHWAWLGGRWSWQGGHWQEVRQGHVWRDGYWERRGSRWHWAEGHWEVGGGTPTYNSGGVEVRDHRHPEGPPQPPPPPGTIVVPSETR